MSLDTIFFCLVPFAAVAYIVLLFLPGDSPPDSKYLDSQLDSDANAIDEEKDRRREEQHHRHQGW